LSSIGERISRWRGKLINTNNIARSEASDFVWTPKNVTDKFAIEGLTNLGTYMENPARLTTGYTANNHPDIGGQWFRIFQIERTFCCT
jgi:hypothetical protein